MKTRRTAVGTAIAAVGIVVALAIGGAAGYFAGGAGAAATTSTVTTTIQGGKQTVTSSVAAPTQEDLAKAECASSGSVCVTIYSTIDSSDWLKFIQPAIYAQYPWLSGKLQYVGLSSAQQTARTISEFKAGTVSADVVQGTIGPLYPIFLSGAIQNYSSPLVQKMNYTKDAYDSNGQWAVVFRSIPVMTYNPQQLAKFGLPTPTQYQDLANPVYKGHIGFQTGTSLSSSFAVWYYLSTKMSNATWTTMMQNIAANQPVLTAGAGDTTDNVVAGRVAVGISLFDDYSEALRNPNATGKIAAVPNTAVVYNPSLTSLATKAPHPQTAKLVIDWLISSAGQEALALSDRPPYQALISAAFGLQPPGNPINPYAPSPGTVFGNRGKWSDLMKSIFGG